MMGYCKAKSSPEALLREHDGLIRWFVIVGLIGALLGALCLAAMTLILTHAVDTLFVLPPARPHSVQESDPLTGLFILLLVLCPVSVAAHILGAVWEGSAFIVGHLQSLPMAAQLVRDSFVRLWP